MNDVSFEVDDAELLRKLATFDAAGTVRILNKAISPVARRVRQSLRSATPIGPTGNLKRSITSVARKYSGSGIVLNYVGPNWWNQGRHGHLVEGGTAMRYTKQGFRRGAATAKPFLGPWYQANVAAIEFELRRSLIEALDTEFAK